MQTKMQNSRQSLFIGAKNILNVLKFAKFKAKASNPGVFCGIKFKN
ncbi:hypothetical protein CAMRE0001_1425 [Campylobacter rectus RM3267]|uniref:Uncharacterized protein n=1 Tax=Campylobacter rectus RM3267 TaxID=553218 RepID=B9D0A4_CAMRE|nr:hypothetical protein CAMRE0001_1425 [Campylobacter rectus RM3267]